MLQKPGVTSVLIGARTVEQLKDNLAAVGWSLAADDMASLDQASALEPLYPWQVRDRMPHSY